MKKILLIFLFIILSSNFSLANNKEKITIEDIENVFFNKKKISYVWKNQWDIYSPLTEKFPENLVFEFKDKQENNIFYRELYEDHKMRKKESIENPKKRTQNRGIAKCIKDLNINIPDDLHYYLYRGITLSDVNKECLAKIVRVIMTSSEKTKKKKPGNIFYALFAIKAWVYSEENLRKYVKDFSFIEGEDEPVPGMMCNITYSTVLYSGLKTEVKKICRAFKKSTYKKIEKFKKDPLNQKVLGNKLIKYINQAKMINNIEDKLGTSNFLLLGDMLNETIVDVEKNNLTKDLRHRRILLNKYSLLLNNIKKKLEVDNYKKIDQDISRLSKTYKNLSKLTTTNDNAAIIDKAVDSIFDTNNIIQKSVLNSKDNEEKKLLALSSINFMQSLISSILNTIPEKYYAYTRQLPLDLFSKSELEELEGILNNIINKNKQHKKAELTKSMNIVKIHINTSDVLKTLDNLGMKNEINRIFTHTTLNEIVEKELKDNLDKEVFKSVSNLVQEIDRNELSELSKEASNIASEISSESSNQMSETGSILDKKIGNNSLKKLIGAGVIR